MQVRTQNFSFGGRGVVVDAEAIRNLCLILKIILQILRCKHNITLPATAFMYIRI
jgi:hypothetical protein